MSGIDPVTINQYWMTERSMPEYEEPAYQWATGRGLVTRPVVFRDAAGAFWKPKAGFDLVVFHPRSQYENGRPAWLRLGGLRSPYLLPMWICGPAKRCLVHARLAAEGKDAIPVDQVLVSAGKPAPALMLPKGDFVVRVEGADGALIDRMPVRMP
ncbi:MAG TPA: hypothetical protein VEL74_06985 [Thermoanaerobaculia bacterium]|nr:hypothetical protein [Thermoanaerobaculia bacterium]